MAHKYKGSHLVTGKSIALYKPSCLSLPNNVDFKSLLSSQPTQLTNRYLVTRVIQGIPVELSKQSDILHGCESSHSMAYIQCLIVGLVSELDTHGSSVKTCFCLVAKPLVWHREGKTKGGLMILDQLRERKQRYADEG